MFDNLLRPVKEVLFSSTAKYVPKSITPNQITLLSGVFGLASAVAAFYMSFNISLLLWVINRILDGLDGVVARINNNKTEFGGLLDLYVDFCVYCAVPIGIICSEMNVGRALTHFDIYAVITLGTLLSSYMVNGVSWMVLSAILESKVKTEKKFTTVHMPTGLIEGTETIVFYIVWLLVVPISFASCVHLMLLFSLMVIYTSITRLYWAY
ncbi:4 TM domain-containing transmembrane protein, partial [Acrasis kona]